MTDEASGGADGPGASWPAAEAWDTGRLLRAMRRARGTSQRQFGVMVGVAASMIARYEMGRRVPGVAQFDVMARAAGFRLLLVEESSGRVLVVDDEHDAIRDRGGRRFPAHLHWGGRPNCTWADPPWWGWHSVAWSDRDPAVPDHVYWSRRVADGSPWSPGPTGPVRPYMGDDTPGPDGTDWGDPDDYPDATDAGAGTS